MRINEIFRLLQVGLSDAERIRAQDLIRQIIVGRRAMLLCNDVSSLYRERRKVADHLGIPVRDLDVVWELPSVRDEVRAVVKEEAMSPAHSSSSNAEAEEGTDTGTLTGADTNTDTSTNTDTDKDRDLKCSIVMQEMCILIKGLRRQVFLFGVITLLLHVVTTVMLTSACTPLGGPLCQLKGSVWFRALCSNATAVVRQQGSVLIHRLWAARVLARG